MGTLVLDARMEVDRIVQILREQVFGTLRRRGVVVGLSGGIDSSVVASLCARAFGKDKVLGIFMPERHSSGDSLRLGRSVAAQLGIDTILEDIAPALEAVGAYRRQIEAIQTVVPQYGDGWKCKLVLASVLESNGLNITRLTVQDPEGKTDTVRLSPAAYLQIVAATNYKQRLRKMTEYYHADRLNYAVAGTPNRLEHDQGFFVKQGDGTADLMPIVHLYKTQVYQLAEYLGVDEEIRRRPPTTDTFSMAQSQEEFYFALPYHLMDLCLYGLNHGISADEVAAAAGLTAAQVEKVFKDIDSKRRAARYLHARPLLSAAVGED
ncbi:MULTISPECIES: NAD(+) synthase [unclassified Mesorhizobium]|uniref:NAD(+) synthase n=1 Tax=unclassified Mesorhizobium TaxID=325217 RepID=UPI000FCABDCA|nr:MULTISPECIES: NAD(+) synthase [unclassified Mesorhizobium]RUU26930.1 NAD(+) synthase [Mesorhizobium sp. M6A.T.Ca.TU.002.02.2.1]RUU46450.1 NAD(+) synthase [Mesorhizobium sp. M6A.T.Ce.TU.002.03.1.1]RVB75581.1 NAD(+) synthase [Mesorhizobium sp. M6A.T.Cr.TU.014.01.1.1]RWP73061.1 MAG: NAD(+) synthase [Mesorhizobium sp.]RWQ03204.1 MAG: NAD(+) synthase [Mesorhizobium sp.]